MQNDPFKPSKDIADIDVGLIGSGIQSSRTPLMHMREAEAQGFSLNYRLFDLELLNAGDSVLPGLLGKIENAGYAGVNITHPCKQEVIRYLDELSTEAADLGAVNTVIFRDNRRIGHNSDWLGFYRSFNTRLTGIQTGKVLQLGAGGAGSAVAYALARSGIRSLFIYDLDMDKAKALVSRLTDQFPDLTFNTLQAIGNEIPTVDGIINTTPVGMDKYPGLPLPADLLQSRHWVADVIYFPLETELLRTARDIGCITMDGSGMAINQAVEAFRLFTGKNADSERMSHTFFNEFR